MPIGGVVEGEALAPVEDRDGGRELVKGARMGIHLARKVGAHALQFGKIRRLARRSARTGQIQHIHQIAAPGDDRMNAPAPHTLPRARGCGRFAIMPFEQFQLAVHHVRAICRFHRPRIGGVGPGQAPCGVARPYRARQGVEQVAQRFKLRPGARVAFAQLRQFEPVAGNVANAQHGAAAHSAALGFEVMAGEAGERQTKSLAPCAQARHGALKRLRRFRSKPGSEGQRLARRGAVADQRQIARDVGLLRGGAPGDKDLRFRGQEHVSPVQIGAHRGELARQHRLAQPPSLAASQMDEGRGGGDARQSDDEEKPDERLGFGRLMDRIRALRQRARSARARQQRKGGEACDRQGELARGGQYRRGSYRARARSVPWPPRSSHRALSPITDREAKCSMRSIQRANQCTLPVGGLVEEVVNQMNSPPRANAEANFRPSAQKALSRSDQ